MGLGSLVKVIATIVDHLTCLAIPDSWEPVAAISNQKNSESMFVIKSFLSIALASAALNMAEKSALTQLQSHTNSSRFFLIWLHV